MNGNWYNKISKKSDFVFDPKNKKMVFFCKNPSPSQILKIVLNSTYGAARGLLDHHSDSLYVWNANDASHRKFANLLDIDISDLYAPIDEWEIPLEKRASKGYPGDGMLFTIGPEGELRTALSPKDSKHPIFSDLIPYTDPKDSGDDYVFYTHKFNKKYSLPKKSADRIRQKQFV